MGKGYDHNFVLIRQAEWADVASASGRTDNGTCAEVWTTEGEFSSIPGIFGMARFTEAEPLMNGEQLCLETQHFPDSPNQCSFLRRY